MKSKFSPSKKKNSHIDSKEINNDFSDYNLQQAPVHSQSINQISINLPEPNDAVDTHKSNLYNAPIFEQQNNLSSPSFPLQSTNSEFFKQISINSNSFDDDNNLSLKKNNFSYENYLIIKKIKTEDDENLHVVSVIITICSGHSYDNLFREVPQKAPEGRVALFEINENSIPYFIDKFNKKEFDSDFSTINHNFVEKINEIFDYIDQIEPECVLFNYECCSNCGEFKFLREEETNTLIDIVIQRKSNFMFSDFSVKSLLRNWDQSLFGKNPFKEIGSCSSYFKLKFDAETLKKCDSPQLQIVGTLCEDGKCKISVMSHTIVFGVDKEKIDNEKYDLKVLTIIDNIKDFMFDIEENQNYCIQKSKTLKKEIKDQNEEIKRFYVDLNEKKGCVGHAILTFKSGGKMILSAGHWIELSQLDVKLENLEKVSQNVYKNKYDNEILSIKDSNDMSLEEKKAKVSALASKFIQQSSTNNYSKKTVYKSKK